MVWASLIIVIACAEALAAAPMAAVEWRVGSDGVSAAERRAEFAASVWRQRPLVVRGAVDAAALAAACDVDLLAGLALEEDVVSRLVCGEARALEFGPFGSERLAALPDSGWTLLVNDADRFSPAIASLSTGEPSASGEPAPEPAAEPAA